MLAGLAATAWVIPDVRTAFGIVQWALEFPLYHALFIRGLLARGEKIPVIVREAPARLCALALARAVVGARENRRQEHEGDRGISHPCMLARVDRAGRSFGSGKIASFAD